MASNSEIRFYVDTMIVETILSDDKFYKKANILSDITSGVSGYISNHIDPNDKAGSLLDILAPGLISTTFSAMGLGTVGLLLGFAVRFFDIDVKGILTSIYDGVKSLLSGGDASRVSSSQVDNIVQTAVQNYSGDTSQANDFDIETISFDQEIKNAKLVKLALISYDKEVLSLHKEARGFSLGSRKGKTLSILGRVLSWIFKVALSSAGFMVAGDAVNKLLDKPNAFDNTLKDGKPVANFQTPVSAPKSTQTKFPLKSNYVDTQYNNGTTWIEKITNNKSNIENMLVSFVKEVYSGLDGQDALIKSNPSFKVILDNITWYNHKGEGDPIVFIPKMFTSKKQLVDHFIDQIAKSPSITAKPSGSSPEIKPNIDAGERSA